ncbi:MAG: helix-turn-helix domain-containing protein [Chloroflexi bacterium]|nr:helix-turn-helix domain-containing protein [Chloroflexota bacterium]
MSTTGEQLKLARETRKLTIKQVVQVIRVRAHYLLAMEADDFSAMPSAAQARGFLRIYAEFLGLDADMLTDRLRTEIPSTNHAEEAPIRVETSAAEPEAKPAPAAIPEPAKVIIAEPPQQEFAPAAPSIEIFAEIGSMLRSRRELISLTLDEVERHTHVRKHNLELIETGDFDMLASPVQLRGTLGTYASFLDLDVDALLLRYADAIQSRRIERQATDIPKSASQKVGSGLPIWLRRFISPDLIFGGSMILILMTLTIWGAGRIFAGSVDTQNVPTQGPSISDVLLASPIASSTSQNGIPTNIFDEGTVFPTLDSAQINPTESPPAATISSAVQITVAVVERTFLRVTVDGVVKQDGRVSPGAALTFDGSNQIEVLTGSGTAVQIIFNQNNLGLMGNFGEVVDRIYTTNGVETPTLTPSPTASITPVPSRTPRPSPTSRPSPTKKPTSTSRPSSTIAP